MHEVGLPSAADQLTDRKNRPQVSAARGKDVTLKDTLTLKHLNRQGSEVRGQIILGLCVGSVDKRERWQQRRFSDFA